MSRGAISARTDLFLVSFRLRRVVAGDIRRAIRCRVMKQEFT